MIYIVSGIHRSGTSMMMSALVRGGIKPYYSEIREHRMKLNNRPDHVVNDEFYEVGQEKYMRYGFCNEVPENCCVKIQAQGLPILPAARGYKIIYMRRDPAAIRQSYEASFSDSFDRKFPDWPATYWNLLDGVKGIMEDRRNVDLLELWYNDVLDDPRAAIDKVKAFGFPINPDAALTAIVPSKRRYA